jgi:hypothetical protein
LLGNREILDARPEILRFHDARIVDKNVEGRELGLDLGAKTLCVSEILDIDCDKAHTRVGAHSILQNRAATASKDDPIAIPVKGLCQASADSGAPAGDENAVACWVHVVLLSAMPLTIDAMTRRSLRRFGFLPRSRFLAGRESVSCLYAG